MLSFPAERSLLRIELANGTREPKGASQEQLCSSNNQESKQRYICSTLLSLDGATRTIYVSNENVSSSNSNSSIATTQLDGNKILLIIS